MIKIAIAEDISKLAEALKEKIEFGVEFKISSISSNGQELIERLENNHAIDIVFMDINMPVMNGIEATEIIANRWPNIKVVMCTVFNLSLIHI